MVNGQKDLIQKKALKKFQQNIRAIYGQIGLIKLLNDLIHQK